MYIFVGKLCIFEGGDRADGLYMAERKVVVGGILVGIVHHEPE